MTPSRPYLLRALNEWILDNDMTPHIVINANYKGTVVPREHVEGGQIILCIAPQSVHGLEMENDHISFAAKFAGVSRDIYLPIMSITAIYAEENRKGMVFADEVYETSNDSDGGEGNDNLKAVESPSNVSKSAKSSAKPKSIKGREGRPKLKIVSSNPDPDDDE